MTGLAHRPWLPEDSEALVASVARATADADTNAIAARIDGLIRENRAIHERDCINLNPATNVMNPRAEAALAAGLGTRPSLGYPGAKYETGLEAVEQIEVIAAELAAEVFGAPYVEIRCASGAMANLYAFMACTQPGDAIIVPPPTIGGHVTHHEQGAAGLYGLDVHWAPVDPERYTVDVGGLGELAKRVRPKLITLGGSLNLAHHPVAAIRAIADDVGAKVLFDAAHLSGLIAGGAWPNPLAEGANVMTMSTYKSLAGPPAGLLLTTDAGIAAAVDAIAYPGLTANFDVAKSAALAISLLDWQVHGAAYAAEMCRSATALAEALGERGVPVYGGPHPTLSHQFAVAAAGYGGGDAVARHLRSANLLASGIGLPSDSEPDAMGGLRLGTPEIVRWGMTAADMPVLASLIGRALASDAPERLAAEVTAYRRHFDAVHFVR